MAKPFKGTINVDIRDSEPDWTPFEPPVAPYGAPNVVYVTATEDMPTGENVILSASFDKDGEQPQGVANGTLSLYYGDVKVGQGRIKTQPGKFAIGGEGLCVGRDSGEAVTEDYPGASPWRFTGGTIKQVNVNVSGKPYVDLEREAIAMMARE